MNLSEQQIKDLQLRKENAQKLVDSLIQVEKKIKKRTKRSKLVIDTAKSFIKCNITNPVIFEKLERLKQVIEESAHANSEK